MGALPAADGSFAGGYGWSIGTIPGRNSLGLVAGALGKPLIPGDESGVIVVTIRLGIAGAFVRGFVAQPILGTVSGALTWSTIVAALGAIVLLTIYRLIVGIRASSG